MLRRHQEFRHYWIVDKNQWLLLQSRIKNEPSCFKIIIVKKYYVQMWKVFSNVKPSSILNVCNLKLMHSLFNCYTGQANIYIILGSWAKETVTSSQWVTCLASLHIVSCYRCFVLCYFEMEKQDPEKFQEMCEKMHRYVYYKMSLKICSGVRVLDKNNPYPLDMFSAQENYKVYLWGKSGYVWIAC